MMGSYLDAYPQNCNLYYKIILCPPVEVRSGLIMVAFRIKKWVVKLDSLANFVD
jgi:hypothetical protein